MPLIASRRRAGWRAFVATAVAAAWATAPAEELSERIAAAKPEPVSEAVTWLREYLRYDTTNPPGNEARAIEYLARILKAEGIGYGVAETAPGRKNLWARLEGGDQPALLLLHHSDVVSADPDYWDTDPFAGRIRDGFIYGRGALDMKSHGILHLAAFIALHRAGTPLNRDVVFMATADEEAGSAMGMGWMMRNRPRAFRGVGLALTEGGAVTIVGERLALGVEVTQKIPLWVRLEASGPAGHGSTPKVDSALGRLIDALGRIRAHEFEPRIIPVVDNYFRQLAPTYPPPFGAGLRDIDVAIREPEFTAALHARFASLYSLTRNTCAITRAAGSDKVNVVAPRASAELDCRLLPDEKPLRFLALLQRIIDDDSVSIDPLLSFAPSSSATDTVLFTAIEKVMTAHFPGIEAVPTVSNGFTDSHYLRERGVASYGFAPFLIPVEDMAGFHGNNERISIENIDRGIELLIEILTRVVNPPPEDEATPGSESVVIDTDDE